MTVDVGVGWTRWLGERLVYADSDAHVALIARTLGISSDAWSAVLDDYSANPAASGDVAARLRALADAFAKVAPYTCPLPSQDAVACVCCGERRTLPALARRAVGSTLVYGRCGACEHGQLLSGAAQPYGEADYYRRRANDGSGYDAYPHEREYREAKASRLFAWLESCGVLASSLLEVGSGFGYTRKAAEDRGIRSAGVDINPEAVRAAKELYGYETLPGTLADALDSGALPSGAWDLLLFQFVLEHMVDPRAELRQAARALTPGGHLVLIVPSMSTFELEVFGASYRSLRADHLHLFSEPSLRRYLQDARLSLVSLHSHCSLGLLKGFLSERELSELYDAGQGPDLTAVARKD